MSGARRPIQPRLNRAFIAKCGFTCEIALDEADACAHPSLKQPALELAARCSAAAFRVANKHAARRAAYHRQTKATP